MIRARNTWEPGSSRSQNDAVARLRGVGEINTVPAHQTDLGYPELANLVRRICTLCGWGMPAGLPGRVMGIASTWESEGKSLLAQAIAISTAQAMASEVLLAECDLQRPSLGKDFGIGRGPGLCEVLTGDRDLAHTLGECVHPTGLPNLRLLPAGGLHDDPSRLLRSQRMAALFGEMRRRFEFVVLDLPAVLRNSDAAVLGELSDGAVLVVHAGSTSQQAVQQALQLYSRANVHGVVLNRWQTALPGVIGRFV